MYDDIYPFNSANFHKLFTFKSISAERTIVKVVQFSHIKDNFYNLGLADFEKGKLQFTELSNNEDLVRVIGTVAAIVRRFTEVYPEREVVIRGEKRRMQLYNIVFRRRYAEIEREFQVWGYAEDEW
ncbi:MAG TPA: hypothetical protein PK228_01075 [Saprospiraceae bacterium]|nr:hypothetical protein [Saprospiraceae bacterium]